MFGSSFLWKLSDWIFPPYCAGCGKKGFLICSDCWEKVPRVEDHFCGRCGKPLGSSGRCYLCEREDLNFARARAVFQYKGAVAEAIKRLKFHRDLELAALFGDELALLLGSLAWEEDLLVPVPIATSRRRERGFNQSELFGKRMALRCGLLFSPGALAKVRDSHEQAHLSGLDRRVNLKRAFFAEPSQVYGKRVLLVDDVMTTGSTFISCTEALLDAGAARVDCISIATAVFRMAEEDGSSEPE